VKPSISSYHFADNSGSFTGINTPSIPFKSQTVVCLIRTSNHQPMKFPENNFGVGKYYNFIPNDIEETNKFF
jgi:hypothetical protein